MSERLIVAAIMILAMVLITPKRWMKLWSVIVWVGTTIRILVPLTDTQYRWFIIVLIVMGGVARFADWKKRKQSSQGKPLAPVASPPDSDDVDQ